MKKWLAAGAKSCNLGESSTALELVTRERIESVSKHFFTEIWGLGEGSRPRGAPSYEYKKRVEARDALVKAFLEQYDFFWCGSGKFHYFLVWVRQVPLLSLSLSVYFSLPDSLRLTPSFLSLGLNPESAPGIREDLVFLRAREAGAREDLKFKV